jgi:hypothetical protein
VSPFSTEYEPLENVPIAQCATVYTYDISPVLDARLHATLYSSAVQVRTSTALHGAATETEADTGASGRLAAAITGDWHTKVNPENIARLWNVGIETAKRTLQVTTVVQNKEYALHCTHCTVAIVSTICISIGDG